MRIAKSIILPFSVLSICFLVGGPLQFLGILSLTQTNYLALALIVAYLLGRMSVPGLYRSELVLILLSAYVLAGVALNGSDTTGVIVYLYYLACPFLAARFVRHVTMGGRTIDESTIFRWVTTFLILQLVFTTGQNLFAVQLSQISAIDVIPVDIISGTFYMSSDGSLSAFCVLAAMSAVWSSQSTPRKFAVVALSFIVIMLANAKAFQQLFPAIIFMAVICQTGLRGRYAAAGILLASLLGLILLLAASSTIAEQWAIFSDYLFDIYDFRYGDNTAQRLAPLGEILNSPLSIFGKGALTYYNPISKQWLYNSGFSLIYNFYIDYGAIGLLLVLMYFLSLTIEIGGLTVRALLTFGVLLVFCMFSPAITDLAFIIAYTGTCYLIAHRRHIGNHPVISGPLSNPLIRSAPPGAANVPHNNNF